MKKYPRIGDKRPQGSWSKKTGFVPKVIGKCRICKTGAATYYVDVQFSIFRGDDKVYKVCRECVKNKLDTLLEAPA